MLAITVGRPLTAYLAAGFGLIYLSIALWFLPGFIHWDGNVYAGLLLVPYICTANRERYSLRYLVPAVALVTLAVFIPVRTTFFLAMLFSLLLLAENSLGKLNNASLFLLVLVSPVFKYIMSMVDFPVRLWLTGQVARLLSHTGIDAVAAGNQIELGDSVFSVDPACAGLNMLIMSLLICLFLLTYHQRKSGRQLHFFYLAALFSATIGLNIICNFFRILLLVTFKIMPGQLMHDLVGIICLIVYVLLPLMAGMGFLLKRFGSEGAPLKQVSTISPSVSVRYPLLHASFLIILLFTASTIVRADTLVSHRADIRIPGFEKKVLESGILKFENQQALIYLKPSAFYIPGHDPTICWTGSGYEFKNIREEKWNGTSLYTATLQKGKDKIYAAWWFDNGELRTADHLLWRWTAAKGAPPFYLINVNAASRAELHIQVGRLLSSTTTSFIR